MAYDAAYHSAYYQANKIKKRAQAGESNAS
jgi:hypothetical protein